MAENQEDKTADVKTLYKEPLSKRGKRQLLMTFGLIVALLRLSVPFPFFLCKYYLLLAAWPIVFLGHPFPT